MAGVLAELRKRAHWLINHRGEMADREWHVRHYDHEGIKIRAHRSPDTSNENLSIWVRSDDSPVGFARCYSEKNGEPDPSVLHLIVEQNDALDIMRRLMVLEDLGSL